MPKGLSSTILAASSSRSQEVYVAVEIQTATPVRVIDTDVLTILSAGAFEPWYLDIDQNQIGTTPYTRLGVRLGNVNNRFSALDLSEELAGKVCRVWDVWRTTAGLEEVLKFSGVIDQVAIDELVARFTVRGISTKSRRGAAQISPSCFFNFKGSRCKYAGADTTCQYHKADCASRVGAPNFTGTGLDDLTVSGPHTDTVVNSFEVEIDGTGTPDTFLWRLNGAVQATGVAITGGSQVLSDGISVTFAATTGHTLGDLWTIKGGNVDNWGGFVHVPEPGEVLATVGTTRPRLEPPPPPLAGSPPPPAVSADPGAGQIRIGDQVRHTGRHRGGSPRDPRFRVTARPETLIGRGPGGGTT